MVFASSKLRWQSHSKRPWAVLASYQFDIAMDLNPVDTLVPPTLSSILQSSLTVILDNEQPINNIPYDILIRVAHHQNLQPKE
jgi:hypothetical protein